MLRKVTLKNFKCFDHLDLECASLNLLCGLNGMGKSSLIQALLVLRQSFETGELHRGELVLAGERVDLGTGRDVLFDNAERDVLGFCILSNEAESPFEMEFTYSPESDQLSAVLENKGSQSANKGAKVNDEFQTKRDMEYDCIPEDWKSLPPFGGTLLYVDAERVGPRKFYPLSYTLSRRKDFGARSEYAWNYLIEHQNDLLPVEDPRYLESDTNKIGDIVEVWLQHISPGVHLQLDRVIPADSLIAGFSFDRPGDVPSRPYRATNVGFGLSYTLPVILALLAEPGTLCLIENPESHLHPLGQTKLAELAARASKAGVQVFVETHSDHFMDGVRIAVRDGLIGPEETAFHYFQRDGSRSVVTSPLLDEDGRLSQWPVGFFDQHATNMMKLLAPRS